MISAKKEAIVQIIKFSSSAMNVFYGFKGMVSGANNMGLLNETLKN